MRDGNNTKDETKEEDCCPGKEQYYDQQRVHKKAIENGQDPKMAWDEFNELTRLTELGEAGLYGGAEAALMLTGEWVLVKVFQGGVWVYRAVRAKNAVKATTSSIKLFKSGISQFKNTSLTNAGRAVTKHPQYFGFESTEALMKAHNTPAALNKLGAQSLKNILRNGTKTTGAGGRYPNGWVTYTLKNGNAASWTSDGIFIGFRGIR